MAVRIDKLVPMFGSSREIARVARIDKSAVVRWRQGKHDPSPLYQRRIFEEAQRRGLDTQKVGKYLGLSKCPVCGTYHV